MEKIQLTDLQIYDLAKPIVGMIPMIVKFYEDPENMRRYREWHYKRYGCYPEDMPEESPEEEVTT